MSRRVFLDNAATTPMAPEIIDMMSEMMKTHFANPSSVHSYGRESKIIVENSRKKIASLLNTSPGSIFFTSGGTESDNLAIRGVLNNQDIKSHIITTEIEHNAVLDTCNDLSKEKSVEVSYIKPDKNGWLVSKERLEFD